MLKVAPTDAPNGKEASANHAGPAQLDSEQVTGRRDTSSHLTLFLTLSLTIHFPALKRQYIFNLNNGSRKNYM